MTTMDNGDLTALHVEAARLLELCRGGGRAPRSTIEPFFVSVIALIAHARELHASLCAIDTLARREVRATARDGFAAAAMRRALDDLEPSASMPKPVTRRRRRPRAVD